MDHPFKPLSRRGPARTALGANAAEDAASRKVIRFLYADVLRAFTGDAELATEAADACEIPLARADAVVLPILAAVKARKLRGHASQARYVLRALLADPGLVDIDGRRVQADVTDRQMRRILGALPQPRRSSTVPIRCPVAHGAKWIATLYRPRRDGRFLDVAHVRLGPYTFKGEDLAPAARLPEPDGRTAREAVREWSSDRARRTEGERKLAAVFLRRVKSGDRSERK